VLPEELVIDHLWPKISSNFQPLRILKEEVPIKEKALHEIWTLRLINKKWRHLVDTTVEWNSYREVKNRFSINYPDRNPVIDFVVFRQIAYTSCSLCSLVSFKRNGLDCVPHLTDEKLRELVEFVDDSHLSRNLYKGDLGSDIL
jgi:hypothetical protein